MRYYVVADVHGYYDELIEALSNSGYFNDQEAHKLIVCGDLFDRGLQAKQLQNFILDLIKKDEVILIRGNHEDLALDLLAKWHQASYCNLAHHNNGTINTICQLGDFSLDDVFDKIDEVGHFFLKSDYIQTIIPAMVDYYESEHYIFVHGWIPDCDNWRQASEKAWNEARWINGMKAYHDGLYEKDKVIVCGHWHASYGHCYYENDGSEFGNDANFNPYVDKGIIALDACTAKSKKINCIVIEE